MVTKDSSFTGSSSSEDASSAEEDASLKVLFRDKNNHSLKFFLHKSIKGNDKRKRLKRDITKCGGHIANSEFQTDFVLVSLKYRDKDVLQTSYNADDDHRLNKVYVEYTTFIRRCIKDKAVGITKRIRGMGGRPPGRSRHEFTYEDDNRLCKYLAKLMPEKAAGGRQGINVYKQLLWMAKEIPDRYGWGARHTPESWKERYKKHQSEFDVRIDEIVKRDPPAMKQRWHEDRRASQAKQKAMRNVVELDSDGEEVDPDEEDEEEEHGSEEYIPQLIRKRRHSERLSQPLEPVLKRPRRSQHEATALSHSIHHKGKERAIEHANEEQDENEEYQEMYTPREEIEPGPLGRFRSPERTLVASAPTQEPDFSQQTLRNSPPLGDVSNSPFVLHNSISQNDRLFLNMDSPIVVPGSSQPSFGNQAEEYTFFPEQHLSPVPPPPPEIYKQGPIKVARRPPVFVQPVEDDSAPYRNTRSRSRSVEPTTLPPAKRARRVKDIIMEEPEVIEVSDGEEITQPFGESLPNGEAAVEEVIVENMLIAKNAEDFNNVQDVMREVSMETDDAQIALGLRPVVPASSQIRPHQGFSSLLIRPTEMLQQFENSVIQRPVQLGRPVSMRRSDGSRAAPLPIERGELSRPQLESLPFNFTVPDWDPHTPAQRTRKGSLSSLESFPASGTRASALKKSRQLQEKQTPYQPPDGTRAALFAKSR
ncbi:hypothetical protein CPB84DRAFT_1820728 [Gymnopilus junonius]|uniref:Repressor/activator protein 1 homolog n=1 Tax=Gymnopilus junonius TaxID=109634 RepID=A0A9P5TTV1_GYMJU|nr:hypothetical protein CPB84DRAFT_1820728 [Gymnopilus junonius]